MPFDSFGQERAGTPYTTHQCLFRALHLNVINLFSFSLFLHEGFFILNSCDDYAAVCHNMATVVRFVHTRHV